MQQEAPRVSSPQLPHTPSLCRRRRASASWPQPGRHIKPHAAGRGSLIPRAPRRRPRRTPVSTSLQLCEPSFNGRRPPDAPLFQPQLIAALPSFPASFLSCSLAAPTVTCQKYGGLVSPCAPACWGRAARLVFLHGREGVPVDHPSSHPDRLCQPGPVGCKSDPPICPSCLPPPVPQRKGGTFAPTSSTYLGTSLI